MTDLLLGAVALGDQIERFGAYFGYAAIVGLGLLSLLYFSQAREVKRLREWAGRSPERDAELAQRVQADAQRRAAQPQPRAVAPARPQTAAAQSADAARNAAAAAVVEKVQQAGATPPAAGPAGSLARPAPTAGEAATAAAGVAPDVTAPAPGAAPAAKPGEAPAPQAPATPPVAGARATPPADAPAGSPVPGMSPATASAVAAARQAATRTPAGADANGGGGQETHESDAARPAALPSPPSRAPRSAAGAQPEKDGAGRSGRRLALIIGGAVAAVAVAGVLTLVLTSGGGADRPAGNAIGDASPPPATPPAAGAPAKVDRAATQVAVLNGTTTTGLARGVADKLEKSGFTILSVGDNADQALATTTIAYTTGNERAARSVAQVMDVPVSAVKPIDTNTSVAVAAEAKVVVVVGNDRSSTG